MDVNSQLTLSYYKYVADINTDHNITLVQHVETHKFYVKKVLYQYNKDIYLQLKHHPMPGIPQIYEVIEDNDELIIIEEYISGQTIQEMIDSGEHIDIYNACEYILQICEHLIHLHSLECPIIHRDIKPSNIIITPSKHAVLIDYNAAKFVKQEQSVDTVLLGTKGYAAPEQYGFGASGPKTDIYALGKLIKTIVYDLSQNYEAYESDINSIIKKCTYLDPSQRYDCIRELKADILKLPFISLPQKSRNSRQTIGLKQILPPGYRSGNPLHMLLGTCGYAFIIWMSTTLDPSDSTQAFTVIVRLLCFTVSLALILVSFNYMDIQRFLPLCKNKHLLIRILGVVLYDILVCAAILIFMCLLLSIFS